MTTTPKAALWPTVERVCSADDRAAWLKARTTGVGASESPVLLGASGFASIIELWGYKVGRLVEEDAEQTERQRWGVILEPHVAEEYERRTGRQLRRMAALLRSTEHPFMLATPDYLWDGGPDLGLIPVEIKTTDFSRRSEWVDGPPARVNIQCQHQMMVTGALQASVGLLVGGNTFMWADVEREEALCAQILDACQVFWGLVQSGTLPPVDGTEQTRAALRLLFPRTAEGEELTLPAEAVEWARHLKAAKNAEKMARDAARGYENQLIAAIGSAEVGVLPDGSGAFTFKAVRRKEHMVKASEFRQLRRVGEDQA
jgi:putative phage-type endonuclease